MVDMREQELKRQSLIHTIELKIGELNSIEKQSKTWLLDCQSEEKEKLAWYELLLGGYLLVCLIPISPLFLLGKLVQLTIKKITKRRVLSF